MLDISDLTEVPKSVLIGVLRFLWWLGWEFIVETVFWSFGWLTLRALTLGRYPEERFAEQDAASGFTAFVVQATGALVLALAIWLLSGAWPHI